MASWKELKGRIKTTKNTAKITKAMELISTVKMKKSQDLALSSRNFAIEALKILKEVWESLWDTTFLNWNKINTNKELLIVISSNKWLCWSYNVNIFKKVRDYIKKNLNKEFDVITIGKKAQDFALKTWLNLTEDFSEVIKDSIELHDSKKISKELINKYKWWHYEKIIVFYNYYYSAIKQKTFAKQFLYINKEDIVDYLENIVWIKTDTEVKNIEYKIEPDKKTIINEVIPLILDMMFYEILLETKASEHASRMVAMKNAKDSANKKVTELTLIFNKERQASITREITEIVSWVESLKD